MNLNLKDKIIIVTGGASGIGAEICRVLAEEGAIPCIIDINEENTLKLVTEIQDKGNKIFYNIADLTVPALCKAAVESVLLTLKRIDGLVNNAGLNDGVGLEKGSYENFIASLKKNVGHYYSMAHHALPALKESKGAIVNIVSKTFETGQGGTSGYAAANGSRQGLTEAWADELLPYGIRVNAIVVAECWTPQYEWWINQQANPKETLEKIVSKIPLEKRMTTLREIADFASFLLSEASSIINKQLLYVDGGYVHLDRAIS